MADEQTPVTTSEPAPAKLGWRERLAEYGWLGIATYAVVSLLTYLGFFVLITRGFEVEGVVGETSTVFAAWVGLKVTQPIRIGVVLVLTPFVAAVLHRIRGKRLGTVPTPRSLGGAEADTRPDP